MNSPPKTSDIKPVILPSSGEKLQEKINLLQKESKEPINKEIPKKEETITKAEQIKLEESKKIDAAKKQSQ